MTSIIRGTQRGYGTPYRGRNHGRGTNYCSIDSILERAPDPFPHTGGGRNTLLNKFQGGVKTSSAANGPQFDEGDDRSRTLALLVAGIALS